MEYHVLFSQDFPTCGNEIHVSVCLRKRIGQKMYTGLLTHTNIDGEYEVMLRCAVRTPLGLKRFIEKAEDHDFNLPYDLPKMKVAAKKLPPKLQKILVDMAIERDMRSKPIKKGKHTIRYMTAKESAEWAESAFGSRSIRIVGSTKSS